MTLTPEIQTPGANDTPIGGIAARHKQLGAISSVGRDHGHSAFVRETDDARIGLPS